MKPTQQELIARFGYDPATGVLTRLGSARGRGFRREDRVAGHTRKDGYVHVQVDGYSYYAHCLIWCWMSGEWPTKEVDHIDLVRDNNRWTNLRLATSSQNAYGRRNINPNRGIERLPNGKYRPHLGFQGTKIHLGCFDDIAQAREARERKVLELFGEFAGAIAIRQG